MQHELDDQDLKALEQRLRALHVRLLQDVSKIEENALGNPADPTAAQGDAGVVDAAAETGLGILEQDEGTLNEVVAAIARLDEGTYGRCEDCAVWIAPARLQALPYARRCATCQTVDEQTADESRSPGRE